MKITILALLSAFILSLPLPNVVSDDWGNAPDFKYLSYEDGKTHRLSESIGQTIVVNFWAVW